MTRSQKEGKPSVVRHAVLLLILVCALFSESRGSEPAPPSASPLALERSIPLIGVSGRIDHMAIDLARRRLFVAELGNGTVDVVDLAAGTVVHRIDGLSEPQAVGYSPTTDMLAVASAGDGSVRFFQGGDFSPAGAVDLGDDADNVRLEVGTGRLVVGFGDGGLAVLDPASRSVVSRVKLPAHPEGFQLDPATHRAFVNVPDARQIAVMDMSAGKQVASWRIPDLRGNFPMALDDAGTLIATVFRAPARLVLLDAGSATMTASLATCGDADDVFFDSRRQRIYVSCGEGEVDVLRREATGYRRLGRIRTGSGARTSLFVPELDRLFVAARAGFGGIGSNAAILEFRPRP